MLHFELELYSPRWGHPDKYEIDFTHDYIEIKTNQRYAKCSWVDGYDPRWSGSEQGPVNPLEAILLNDHIQHPKVFVKAVQWAWEAWRNGEIGDEEIKEEFKVLFEWVDTTTNNRPKTNFWQKLF